MDRRVRFTMEFLERSGHENVSIARLALRVGLGYSRLAHLFKRDAAICIRRYVTARGLDEAARLIASTERRISEILYSVGFRDAANFAHAFKRRFGMSPRQNRARHRHESISCLSPESPD